ncbi:MAG: hypothetical protein FIA95_04255, partial [Gemmatimonadetes bacterium]|nr:hypothetical protein [Gemmatimonadota bacterium]
MKRTSLLIVGLAVAVLPAAAVPARGGPEAAPGHRLQSLLDSARDEMQVGRHWHATRMLRRLGADTASDPSLRALLVRAEAGWGNWAEVARLLGGAGGRAAPAGAEELLLLGRALEESGRHEGAVQAYRDFLGAAGPGDPRRPVASTRLARVALAAGRTAAALGALESMASSAPSSLLGWAAVEGAEARARAGDTAAVARFLGLVQDRGARDGAWDVIPRARLAAGDSLGAELAFLSARESGPLDRRGEAAAEAGSLALARGDSTVARRLQEEGLESHGAAARARAAAALLSFGDTDPALTLRMATALDAVNDWGPALRAYDRAARLARAAGTTLADSVRLSRARLMSRVASRQAEALEEFRAIRAASPAPEIGAENLELWARLRQRQGRATEVATLRRWLVEEYPASPQAAEVVWELAQQAEAEGKVDVALRHYAALATHAPAHPRAAQGRRRAGRILLGRGEREEAARTYEGYLADFPDGLRWQEASFWAARLRLELGDEPAARRLLARLRREEPVSYYAVMGADLLGEPYAPALAAGDASAPPAGVGEGMAGLRLLEDAGLSAGAEREVARLSQRARTEP